MSTASSPGASPANTRKYGLGREGSHNLPIPSSHMLGLSLVPLGDTQKFGDFLTSPLSPQPPPWRGSHSRALLTVP